MTTGGFSQFMERNVIIKASAIVAGITLLTKLIGYAEKVTVAYFWGTDYKADTFNAIFTIIIGIFILFREVFEPATLNLLIKTHSENGRRESWKVFCSAFILISSLAIIFSSCLYVWPGSATKIFLSGFSNDKYHLATEFFKISSIALLFLIAGSVTNTCLLSFKKFTTIAMSEFAFKAVILVSIFFLYSICGIYSTIIGIVAGAIVKFIFQAWRLKKHLYFRNFTPQKDYVKLILLVSWPLLIGNIFSQLGSIIDNVFASHMAEGSISSLTYAKKIVDLPVSLIPYTLSVVVFPFFSQLSIEKDIARLNSLLNNSIKYLVLFFVPVMLLIGLFSEQIIRLFFERGAFTEISTALTSEALWVYNWGLVVFALETILVVFLFGNGKIKLPVITGIICVMLNILITWGLIERLGYLAIAWGLVIAKSLKLILLLYFARENLSSTGLQSGTLKFLLCFAVFALPILIYRFICLAFIQTNLQFVVSLALLTTIMGIAYCRLLIKFDLISAKDKF